MDSLTVDEALEVAIFGWRDIHEGAEDVWAEVLKDLRPAVEAVLTNPQFPDRRAQHAEIKSLAKVAALRATDRVQSAQTMRGLLADAESRFLRAGGNALEWERQREAVRNELLRRAALGDLTREREVDHARRLAMTTPTW